MSSSKRIKGWAAAGLIATAGAAASCDRSDPVSRELERVSTGYNSLSTSGSTPLPSVEQRKEVYQWGINRLTGKSTSTDPVRSIRELHEKDHKPLDPADVASGDRGSVVKRADNIKDDPPTLPPATESKLAGQAAAANLLVVRGHAGLGEIASQDASLSESGWLNDVGAVRAGLDQWLAQQSVAEALVVYDPSADLAKLDQQIAQRKQEAEAQRADKAKQDAVVADLEQRAAQAAQQATVQRDQETQVRASAVNASQTKRLDLIENAARLKRAGDDFDKQGAYFLAEAAKEKPGADEIQKQIDRLNRQAELLEEAKKDIRARADKSAAEAAKARAEAKAEADRLDQGVAGLSSGREKASTAAQEAVSRFEQAVVSARKASQGGSGRESKSQALIAAASYKQAEADVLASKARGLGAYAALLEAMGTVRPPLPNAEVYRSKAREVKDEFEAAKKTTKDAYTEAMDMFKGAGGSGDTQDRLAKLSDAIKDLNEKIFQAAPPPKPKDEAPAAAAPAAPAAASAPTGAEEGEIRAALDAFVADIKAGKYDSLPTYLVFENDDQKQTIEILLPLAGKFQTFDKACKDKWQKDFGTLVQETKQQSIKSSPVILGITQMTSRAGEAGGFDQLSGLNAADAKITVKSATEADVSVEGRDGKIGMLKQDGHWKARFELPAGMGAMGGMVGMFKPVGEIFDKLTANIAADKYSDPDAMLLDFNKELLAAMTKMQGLPGGSGGGRKPGGSGGG